MLIRENKYVVHEDSDVETFLRRECLFFNRVSLDDFLAARRVHVNGDVCLEKSTSVRAGDEILLLTPQSFEPPVNDAIAVLFEDEDILVVNKPAPLPLHPAGRHYFNTLTSLLVRRGMAKEYALFPVQRLDRETSGVVVFAKTASVAAQLAKQFVKRTVQKEYIAICHGVLKPSIGLIDAPLKKQQVGAIRDKMVVADDGLPSVTGYEVRSSIEGYSLVVLRPETGRRHQLRAHLASRGYPIVGDKLYATCENIFLRFMQDPLSVSDKELCDTLGATRQFLHALRLSFKHPTKGLDMSFFAKVPDDMVSFSQKNNLDCVFTP